MHKFGLLGERLSHSFSPLIHAELGGYEYLLYEKKPEELDAFLRQGDFEGLNVTIPYKKAVIPYCKALSETAKAIGSVNTVTRLADGSLFGDNTDYFGFKYILDKTKINPADGKTVILGSGGSSLTVQAVLRDMGAREIIVVSRNGEDNYSNISKHHDAIMLINTTPVGMYPNNGVSPIENLDGFKNCRAVIDLVYNPLKTELLTLAEERGIAGINGLAMLVAQAKKAAEIFTGENIPDKRIEEVTDKLNRKTQNIILIGMPGCGKSSIGEALAKITGREFADTDALIEKKAGKTIPDIFSEDGEDLFRDKETDALCEVCKKSGLVIAAGGGIVKRSVNKRIMKQNGIIVFLDRVLTQLPVTNRPLSKRYGVAALAEERLPIYREWCDYIVEVRGVEETARDIINPTPP